MRLLTVLLGLGTVLLFSFAKVEKPVNPLDYVNPFVGTGGHGHTFPGATAPFGMVQLSPDTRLDGWDGCSGYHYSDSVVYGFSHTHLSGTGCSDYGDILLMPTTGQVKLDNGFKTGVGHGYSSRFSKKTEKASPGYYSVMLDDYNVKVELTATTRAGFHKYTFPASKQSNIIIDLLHRDEVLDSKLKIVSNTEIEGFRRSKAWADDQHVYFVARFSKPFEKSGIALNEKIVDGAKEISGKDVKGFFTFTTTKNEVIYVKVGISGVSIEGARKNLDAEITGWDFDQTVKDTRALWSKELSKIEVEGGTKSQLTTFYSALYHTMIQPNVYMDVDGNYRGRDLKIHHADNFTNYTVFSLWDTYRACHPLYTLIQQKRTNDFINTFLTQYDQGGLLPVWELSGNETNCMIAYHSVPVIVDAYLKGIRGFDKLKALEAMKASADQDHLGLKAYKQFGYIPADKEVEEVSKTLEYAYDDWCIAQFAKDLGNTPDYERFIKRAQYYKNMFDPSTGNMRAIRNGAFISPFDAREVNSHYTEANSWQYSFAVQQDITGLLKLEGGAEKFGAKLDELFNTKPELTGRDLSDISGLIGQYAHGNEPSHHMAYLYNYAQQAWKTQEKISFIEKNFYTDQPDGLIGNEDCGQMSAWHVLSAMGFYSVTPGSGYYVIGTPEFKKVTLHLENGKSFTISANGLTDKAFYIQSAKLNGADYPRSFLLHNDIMNGGELVFQMGETPNKKWGTGEGNYPVQAITDHLIAVNPIISSGNTMFEDSTTLTLSSVDKDAKIYYTTENGSPLSRMHEYNHPITISDPGKLSFIAREGENLSFVQEAKLSRVIGGRTIKLNTHYSPQYTAGGDNALIDNLKGGDDFRLGTYQGYEGVNLDAVVDLGKAIQLKKVSIGFIQDITAWAFMPEYLELFVSDDGIDFKPAGKVMSNVPLDKEGSIVKEFTINLTDIKARYIHVVAKNIGKCPPGHKAAGSTAWLFADEITIE
jgi:predicted alpha-1,2-mannosidase